MDSADFKPVFSIPHFLLSITGRNRGSTHNGREVRLSLNSANLNLSLSFSDVRPSPLIKENGDNCVIVLGSPIVGDRIDREKAVSLACEDENLPGKLSRGLNGEFLIIIFNRISGALRIINDRFTSIPLYYHHDTSSGDFHASPYFSDIWALRKNLGLKINHEAICEFLFFQRILWTKTYLEEVLFLPDASIMDISGNRKTINRYWQRDYQKNTLSLDDNAHRLADYVRKSVRNKTSDGRRYGHFLSGGMDSRSVLASFEGNYPTCFTATLSENRELRTARQIAHTKGARHVFLKLHPDHYSQIYEPASRIIGGMYNYDHGIFLGFADAVAENADVCFHGHGFDYMFQGMYIPSKPIIIRGRTLYFQTMLQLPQDLVSYFISNVSYRIKNADMWKFVRSGAMPDLKARQHDNVLAVLSEGRKLTGSPNDLWEYLTFHHVSRHYTFPNHAAMSTMAEQRVVSFDNDIFDLYHSLPVEHRFSGRIEKKCLQILDPRLARIWSANTNLPVTASPMRQTLYQLGSFLKHRVFPEKAKPEWTERTWPSREFALRNQPILKKAVNELCKSDTFEEIGFIDIQKVRDEFPRWLEGEDIPGISGDLVQTFLTLGTFLRS